MSTHVLIIDDDPVQRRLLRSAVEHQGYTAILAEHGRAGLEVLKQRDSDVQVIVLDLMMPEMDGLSFLAAMKLMESEIPVIVQTGQGGIETVVSAMRAGAFDFVVKPVSPERIGTAITNALRVDRQDGRGRLNRRARNGQVGFEDIVSASPSMQRVIDLAKRAALSNIPVVLEGESGVGKEMVARAIQSMSERASKPFVTVNCGAIPANLVESILFGHEKGAFTGATEKHSGKFVDADGGTLFLDEIGDLPMDVQVKLLRAVQQGEIETVGSKTTQKVNVRLISATNKNLIEEVMEGRFREDLYYRLNVFPITIPALRKRKEDIPALVRSFIGRFCQEQKLPTSLAISASALGLLTAYDWPGNIRQLENAIFRAVVLANGSELTAEDFPQIAAQIPGYLASGPVSIDWQKAGLAGMDAAPVSGFPHVFPAFESSAPASANVHPSDVEPAVEPVISSLDARGDVRKLAEVEEELIRFALQFYHGQMSEVARKLGIGRSTLYRKLKDFGIDPDQPLTHAA